MVPKTLTIGFLTVLSAILAGPLPSSAQAPVLKIEVDATDLPRRLLHSTVVVPVTGETLVVWYPKWIPGVHSPGGPIQNLGGLMFETMSGEPLDWDRDPEEFHRFLCSVPESATAIRVKIDYITNQPSVNSVGVDSYGNPFVGIIDWNTCLIYPEGFRDDGIEVDLSVRLPEQWKAATALSASREEQGRVRFARTTLRTVIDSPLVAGEFLRSIPLEVEAFPPHYLNLVSESESAIGIKDDLIENYRRLVAEAKELFGKAHYPRYEFLLVLSDSLPNLGLEHLASSLNGIGERGLLDEKDRKGWPAYLLPHEFVHSWCGKYRRPRKMVTGNFHEPQQTEHLWVYEGLTQYLGEVLTVRSGLLSVEEYRDRFTRKVDRLMNQTGRQWRTLADTAISNYILRGHSPNWSQMRRGQDYYDEGLLVWMEVDARIRKETDGRKSLDDFCSLFFGKGEDQTQVLPFDFEEVLEDLSQVSPYDWKSLFEERVYRRQDHLSLEFIDLLGYRMSYESEPTQYLKDQQKDGKYVTALDSLGAEFNEAGEVTVVVPGGLGDKAGLAPGMKVMGVNDRKFSRQRLEDALSDSIAQRKISLLVLEGDRFRTLAIGYADGPKFLRMKRDEGKQDRFAEILEPRSELSKKKD